MPQNNPTSRTTIFRFRYTVKANEYVTHVIAIQDADGAKGVVTNPCGTLVMDERTFAEFRAAVNANPQFEFFDQAAPGVSR